MLLLIFGNYQAHETKGGIKAILPFEISDVSYAVVELNKRLRDMGTHFIQIVDINNNTMYSAYPTVNNVNTYIIMRHHSARCEIIDKISCEVEEFIIKHWTDEILLDILNKAGMVEHGSYI